MGGIKKRKNESGAATAFITRGRALKRLQLSLQDFRRICILKGIYPHEPRHPKKAGKGSTAPVTYYFMKDIQFLMHEPIVRKIRDFKIFVKKLKKAIDKKDPTKEKILRKNKPVYTLDHIVKERYPTLVDAMRDLDDALSLCFLFAKMPKNKKVHAEQTRLCRRLTVEFLNYIIASNSLRKVFISIKGFYFQVEIQGQSIIWLMPHNVAYEHPVDVDYRIMSSFVEFSCVLLGFINFALYKSLELHYPPQVTLDDNETPSYDLVTEILSALTTELKGPDYDVPMDTIEVGDESEVIAIENLKVLFKELKFFLNREVDREIFSFIIRSCGGEVSWCKSVQPIGATYDSDDKTITHQVVDRPNVNLIFIRQYVQPQWIVDCVNARKLLPTDKYRPGVRLPPHLSPFVGEDETDYTPTEKIQLLEEPGTKKIIAEPSQPKPVSEGKVMKPNAKKLEEMANEERKLAELAIPKKNKRLYQKLKFMNKKKKQEAKTLAEKRKKIEEREDISSN